MPKNVITTSFALLGWRVEHSPRMGFTLAEVLITLGIIGIVAAMTIPTLITNNQEKGWDVSASTFEAKFGQALKVMNTQNTLAGLNTTENFVAELQRHMKINKVCDNSKLTECFTSEINGAKYVVDVADATTYENDASKPTKTNTLITADKIGQKDWNTNTMGLQFANGVSAIVAYNPKCTSDPFNTDAVKVSGDKDKITFTTDCVAMVYDVQAFKNPNELHKDIRTSSMATVADGNCVFKIDGKCVKAPFSPTPVTKAECEQMKTEGYIITAGRCTNNYDYWTGAVKECGGTNKMASMEDLGKIATYVYNKDIGAEETIDSGLTLNATKVSELGLPSSVFTLFSGEEHLTGEAYSDDNVYYRTFLPTNTYWGNTPRANSSAWAVCFSD